MLLACRCATGGQGLERGGVVATFMMQQGGGFQDSRDAAEVPDPLAHFTGIGQQLVGIVVSAGDDSQHGCQGAGRGYPPLDIRSAGRHRGLACSARRPADRRRYRTRRVPGSPVRDRATSARRGPPLHGLGEQAITAALVSGSVGGTTRDGKIHDQNPGLTRAARMVQTGGVLPQRRLVVTASPRDHAEQGVHMRSIPRSSSPAACS